MKHSIERKVGLAGRFKLRVRRADRSLRLETPWFDNLIVDTGLDSLGVSNNTLAACQVGSGTATPAVGDTALASFVAGTSDIGNAVTAAQSTAPYYISRTRTYEFAEGAAAGNLSEVGISTSGSGGTLFSRALITDGGGSPTTITVLADEFLDVTYELQVIPPTGDQTFNIVDGGAAGTTHAVVMRASNVISSSGWVPGEGSGSGGVHQVEAVASARAYDGAIGATIADVPSGSSDFASSDQNDAYVANSLERAGSATFALGDANFGSGISALKVDGLNGAGSWQMSFDPAIPKTNTDTLELFFLTTWTRTTAL